MTDDHVVLKNSAGTSILYYFPNCVVMRSFSKLLQSIPSKEGTLVADTNFVKSDIIRVIGSWEDDLNTPIQYDGKTAFKRYKDFIASSKTGDKFKFYWYSGSGVTQEGETIIVAINEYNFEKVGGEGTDMSYNIVFEISKR